MGDVELFCLLQGDPLEQSFKVIIPRGNDVHDLKRLIIAECGDVLKGVAVRTLLLYRVSIADDSELRQLDIENNPPLFPRATIGTLFPDTPGENEYILVVNGMMLYGLIYAHVYLLKV
jgi:hypothetical protein